jgi:hypothetical protein
MERLAHAIARRALKVPRGGRAVVRRRAGASSTDRRRDLDEIFPCRTLLEGRCV